jgi:D-apionolactonase
MTEVAVGNVETRRPATKTGLRSVDIGALSVAVGELDHRYISFEGVEIVRRLFVAVRDIDWGTAPTVTEEVAVDVQDDSLTSSVTALCEAPEYGIQFRWRGVLRCPGDGSIEFALQGTALSAFAFARIGLCVLCPPEFAGASYEAMTPSGWITGRLQEEIAPQLPGEHGFGEPLFSAFHELRLCPQDRAGVELKLSGDLFELEDQRNWGDASFKTYSTPLHLGPQFAELGQAFEQRVLITPIPPPERARAPHRSTSTPTLEIMGDSPRVVPDIGVALVGDHDDSRAALEPLRAVSLSHFRVDASLDVACSVLRWLRTHSACQLSSRSPFSRIGNSSMSWRR